MLKVWFIGIITGAGVCSLLLMTLGMGSAVTYIIGLLAGGILQGPCGNHHAYCPQRERDKLNA